MNGNLLSYERISTKSRFENEAKGNSRMGYFPGPHAALFTEIVIVTKVTKVTSVRNVID